MIKVCAGHGNGIAHLWAEVYARVPGHRTLILMWTRHLGPSAYLEDQPFRQVTRSL